MARYPINLSQYQEWKQKTKGGLTANIVHYRLFRETTEGVQLLLEGELPVLDEHRQKVKQGWYSSTVLAALDSVNFMTLLREKSETNETAHMEQIENLQVQGDVTLMQLRPPTFQVVALEECNELGQTIVYVEGRV